MNRGRSRGVAGQRASAEQSTPEVYSITGAATPHSDDQDARIRRYLISMGIRTVCVILVLVVHGPTRWIFAILAIVLPYIAVVMANVAGGGRRSLRYRRPGAGDPLCPGKDRAKSRNRGIRRAPKDRRNARTGSQTNRLPDWLVTVTSSRVILIPHGLHPPSGRANWTPGGIPRGRPASAFWETADVNDAPICSARGCRQPAAWGLLWNNPKLHTPQRRKVWTACEEHRVSLESFLRSRGFLRDTVPSQDLE